MKLVSARLTRTDWKAVLDSAIVIAREWDRKHPDRKSDDSDLDDRADSIREYLEMEIGTLEMLYRKREPVAPLVQMPVDIEKELRRFQGHSK
jgi:hypothetical protein